MLLGKAANSPAPGDDRISAEIMKVFWAPHYAAWGVASGSVTTQNSG